MGSGSVNVERSVEETVNFYEIYLVSKTSTIIHYKQ
jgi:hypothetical protein